MIYILHCVKAHKKSKKCKNTINTAIVKTRKTQQLTKNHGFRDFFTVSTYYCYYIFLFSVKIGEIITTRSETGPATEAGTCSCQQSSGSSLLP